MIFTPEERRAILALLLLLLLGHGIRTWQEHRRARPDRELSRWLAQVTELRREDVASREGAVAPADSTAGESVASVETARATRPNESGHAGGVSPKNAPAGGTGDPDTKRRDGVDRAVAALENRSVGVRARADAPPGLLETGRICLDRAGARDLESLPGIGPALAGRILAARASQPFRSVDDLLAVKGIGPRTLEKLRPLVQVGCPAGRGAGGPSSDETETPSSGVPSPGASADPAKHGDAPRGASSSTAIPG